MDLIAAQFPFMAIVTVIYHGPFLLEGEKSPCIGEYMGMG